MFDVVFISYDEPNADDNWRKLLEIAPHATRVHGVKGIANAHIEAAKQVNTSHFFTVDGDNEILDTFNWMKVHDFQKNDKRIHVWRCKNIVNGLVYGYGGVKLWPTEHIENIKEYSVDFTTSVAKGLFKIQNDIASVTHFNTTPFNAWKSGFREATKLASEIIHNFDNRTKNRLHIWMSVGLDTKFGEYTILGARQGANYGLRNKNNERILSYINDFDWCKEQFATIENEDTHDVIDFYGIILKRDFDIDVQNFTPQQSAFLKQTLYNL